MTFNFYAKNKLVQLLVVWLDFDWNLPKETKFLFSEVSVSGILIILLVYIILEIWPLRV